MAIGFSDEKSILNRAIQYVGGRRIGSLTEHTRNASEGVFLYDKARRAELRRAVWTFATRRAVLRKSTTTTRLITPIAWASVTTYPAGAVVLDPTDGMTLWISRQDTNLANTPAEGLFWTTYFGSVYADAWDTALAYYPGDVVYASTTPYAATIARDNTIATPPTTGWAAWTGATLNTLVDAAPVDLQSDFTTRNRFYLPNGYLRMAPQDPKQAGVSRLAVSAGIRYHDWEFEDNYFLSATDAGPILFRFVADAANVRHMDDLFCEALAARIAYGLVETLTQNTIKKQEISQAYARFMIMAREQNAIEIGSTEIAENPEENELSTAASGAGAPPATQGG